MRKFIKSIDEFFKRILIYIQIICGTIIILTILNSAFRSSKFDNRIGQLEKVISLIEIVEQNELKSESKITQERDSLIRELHLRNIKEDYYINQLDLFSDWIIVITTSLFLLTSLISVFTVKNELGEYKSGFNLRVTQLDNQYLENTRMLSGQSEANIKNLKIIEQKIYFELSRVLRNNLNITQELELHHLTIITGMDALFEAVKLEDKKIFYEILVKVLGYIIHGFKKLENTEKLKSILSEELMQGYFELFHVLYSKGLGGDVIKAIVSIQERFDNIYRS